MPTEAYLLLYSDTDEIHANLISEEHFNRIKSADSENETEEAFKEPPIHSWFTQTHCVEPWPYSNVKILGTICICNG